MSPTAMTGNDLSHIKLKDRNLIVEDTIQGYMTDHMAFDVITGIIGGFAGSIIPGASVATMIAQIAAQAPMFYQPMAKDIAKVYMAEPDGVTKTIVATGAVVGGVSDVAADIGVEFIGEIAWELIWEAGWTSALRFVPFVTALVSAGADAAIAKTMTWRVGTMVAIYCQNGGWIGDRKNTYEIAKSLVKGISLADRRGIISQVAEKVPEIREHRIALAKELVNMFREMGASVDKIREMLRAKQFDDVMDAALPA